MGVPKCKTSKANRRMNRAARCVIGKAALCECPQCHALKQPHHACSECGYYRGKIAIVMDEAAE